MNRLSFVFLAALLATTVQLVGGQQNAADAEKRLARAHHKATVDGDLKAAISEYEQIVVNAGTDRALAAQALLGMADCYQKLGNQEAQRIFERVVREFADQPNAVALARTRLVRSNPTARGSGDRVVKTGESVTWGDGRVSPDGGFISYTDWNSTGNLLLHDLVTGTDRPLTGNKDWTTGNAYASTFSPDGKQIAYGWRTYGPEGNHINELRIVRIETSGIPQPRRVYGNADIDFFNPTDWSPDGKLLAVHVTRRDRSGQIALIGVQDGSFQPLRSVGWRGPDKIFFSPDGKYLAYSLPASDTQAQRDVFVMAADGSREAAAVNHVADDVVMGWSRAGTHLLFASDRTGAVGLWALRVADGEPHGAPAMLKPDIGSVNSLGLTESGALYIVRDSSTESLQVAPIDLEAGKLSGPAVVENFRSARPDWSIDGKQLAYKTTGANGLSALSIRSVESGRIRELWPALLYFNEPRWLPDGRSLVTFGRDFNGRGAIYQIDAQTGRESLIAHADLCRVQVSADGKKIYYRVGWATLGPGQPTTIIEHDLESGRTREVSAGGELSPDGRFLARIIVDNTVRTSSVTLIPIAGGEPLELLRVKEPDTFQASAVGYTSWTPDSQAIIVVKSNGNRHELWLVPVSGGSARKLDIDTSEWVVPGAGIRLHPNGKQIAFFTGRSTREVWALENLLPGNDQIGR
jgi:Tol biopolymer transport system component